MLTVLSIVAKGASRCEKWRDVTKQVIRAIPDNLHDDYSVPS